MRWRRKKAISSSVNGSTEAAQGWTSNDTTRQPKERRDFCRATIFGAGLIEFAIFARDPGRVSQCGRTSISPWRSQIFASPKPEKLQAPTRRRHLPEAKRGAEELRANLSFRGAHPDVLRFCREELLADYYFHAVLEAVKSVGKTGLTDDGGTLMNRALVWHAANASN